MTIMKTLNIAAALALFAAPVVAEGDAAAGEEQFNRQCVSCHVVADADGNVLAGRAAKTGPNLFGVAGMVPGSVDGFRYGASMVEYGETGATWGEESFVAYVMNPTGYLRAELDNNRARAKMSYKVRDERHATDIYAYLATFNE
jgi:cytochrome c